MLTSAPVPTTTTTTTSTLPTTTTQFTVISMSSEPMADGRMGNDADENNNGTSGNNNRPPCSADYLYSVIFAICHSA